ncbi:hypothetical protein J3B02_000146 [Coemansia erecta]|uniref:FAD/NAD(P)-binding domain-containing protein n=1 Tax=Coemansia asiatica TaxID=1052880 RepID=A0A9W8CMK9_9FUNG|nr:hypothetical protein LPJ64_000206 [Coemansia asiatica]KAJ2858556.1 hypothetical protein J3B02_000146 [Coemansia erecta]KAJ2889262.1 hypothetical protein FB639_000040 [Coemansia asiatica]
MHLVTKPVRIAVAGGNFAGLNAVKSLYLQLLATNPDYDGTKQAPPNPNVNITLIDRKDGFVHYLGMTRGLTQPEYGSKLWISYKDMPWLQHPSITVKKNIVSKITSTHIELADANEHIEFDYLVIALGQSRSAPIGVAASTKSEYLEAMDKYQKSIKGAQSVVVVGGGAVGTELAADIKTDYPNKQVTLVHSHDLPVAGPFKDEFRAHVVDVLKTLGVNAVLGERVIEEASTTETFAFQPPKHSGILPELVDSVKHNATLKTTSGRVIKADLVFNALGFKTKAPLVDLPSSTDIPIFSPAGIRVNDFLQVDDPKYPNIFAVGDVSNRGLVKLAGAAANSGTAAGSNIAKLVHANESEEVVVLDAAGRGGRGAGGAGKGSRGGKSNGQYIMSGRSESEYGSIKLVLGEHYAVIQRGEEVVPPEIAKNIVSPDIKLGKATKSLFINSFPVSK